MTNRYKKLNKGGAPEGNTNNRPYGEKKADARIYVQLPKSYKDAIEEVIEGSLSLYVVGLIKEDMLNKHDIDISL